MKLKKYEAKTEQDAMERVKSELGPDALILNIKKVSPTGLLKFMRKSYVEVTAAYDEKESVATNVYIADAKPGYFEERLKEANKEDDDEGTFLDLIKSDPDILNKTIAPSQNEKIKDLEFKLVKTEEMLKKAVTKLTVSNRITSSSVRIYDNNLLQVFYETLTSQGVLPEIAEKVLEEITLLENDIDLNLTVKIVYNKIIKMLGEPFNSNFSKPKKGNPKVFCFIGPTGVGKTTTLAKLSSLFSLKDDLKVCFVTADTYRLAAVSQLKTYGEILGIETDVVYNNDDLEESMKKAGAINDVVMIDTAGRSHINSQNMKELETLLSAVKNVQMYLVLSLTTKFEDLMNIINIYSEISDFAIIFTKSDETSCLGSILNVCYKTGKRVAFITNGQNVPDDIEKIKPDKIAKALLGLGGTFN